MKVFKIIVFTLLLFSIHPELCNFREVIGSSAKDCSKYDKLEEFPYCCYIKGTFESESIKSCYPLKKDEYNNIKMNIYFIERLSDAKIKTLDCKSFYLQLNLLIFIFLLL